MGVKSIPPTLASSRRRDRRSYSPITSISDEEPPQSTRKLDLEGPADPPDGDSLELACNLAVLIKCRRKVVVNGFNELGEHDKALRTLFFPEQCCVTCGPKHVVAITSHPSVFQDPMIHCMDQHKETTPRRTGHKTSLPNRYEFNHALGIDVLEILDADGAKYRVLA